MRAALERDPPTPDEGELWAALYILIGRRFEESLARRLIHGVQGMKESVTYQAILREGRAEEGRTMLVRIASRRFGPPDDAIKARLGAIAEPERLEALADRILAASDWNELLADE